MNEVTVTAPPTRAPILAGGGVSAIVPRSIEDAFRMAEAVCMAGMVPDSYKGRTDRETASKVMIGILKGSEVGFPPMTALANIMIVNNRPCIWGDGALGLCINHRDYAGHKEMTQGEMNLSEKSNWVAVCQMSRIINGNVETIERRFAWSDAMRAGLTRKGPWQQYPARMLQMRARSWAIRDSFADALCGLGIVEEIQDIPVKPAMTDTSFLDDGTEPATPPVIETIDTAIIPEKPVDTTPRDEQSDSTDLDSKTMLTAIKKSFIAIGDDAQKISAAIEAAEGLELGEPYQTELTAILNAKRERIIRG